MRSGKYSFRLSSYKRLGNSLQDTSARLNDDLTVIKLHYLVMSITEHFASLLWRSINHSLTLCNTFSSQFYRFNVTSSLFEKTKGLTL
jgi:hypothetical protein